MPRQRDEEAKIRREARFFMADASEVEARADEAAHKRERVRAGRTQRAAAPPGISYRATAEQRAAHMTIQCPTCFKIRYPPGQTNPRHLIMASHGNCRDCDRKLNRELAAQQGMTQAERRREAARHKAELDQERERRDAEYRRQKGRRR